MNDKNNQQESFADLFNDKDMSRDKLVTGQKNKRCGGWYYA